MITLTGLCGEVNNWFEYCKYTGGFKIIGGELDLSEMVADGSIQNGQYFRIQGSVFNDGIHQFPASDLNDEVFIGSVTSMAIPSEFIKLLGEINAWVNIYASDKAANSPFQSESFGGYSYTKAGSGTGDSNDASTWMGHFKGKLNKWRKLR